MKYSVGFQNEVFQRHIEIEMTVQSCRPTMNIFWVGEMKSLPSMVTFMIPLGWHPLEIGHPFAFFYTDFICETWHSPMDIKMSFLKGFASDGSLFNITFESVVELREGKGTRRSSWPDPGPLASNGSLTFWKYDQKVLQIEMRKIEMMATMLQDVAHHHRPKCRLALISGGTRCPHVH